MCLIGITKSRQNIPMVLYGPSKLFGTYSNYIVLLRCWGHIGEELQKMLKTGLNFCHYCFPRVINVLMMGPSP